MERMDIKNSESDDDTTKLDSDAPRGIVAGTLAEFWLTALACFFANVFGIAAAHAVKRRSVRAGSLLGGGLSIIVAGAVLTMLILTDVVAIAYGFALVPLAVAAVTGPLCVYRGMNGWIFLSNRSNSRVDILIVIVVVSLLIVLMIASLVRMVIDGLMHAM